jgi:hypothetical protein
VNDGNSKELIGEDQSVSKEKKEKKAQKAAKVTEARTNKVVHDLQLLIDQHWTKSGQIMSVFRGDVVTASYESGVAEYKDSLSGSPRIRRSQRFVYGDVEQTILVGRDVFYIVLHTDDKATSNAPLYLHNDGAWRRVALCDEDSCVVGDLRSVLLLTSLLLPCGKLSLLDSIEQRITQVPQLKIVN